MGRVSDIWDWARDVLAPFIIAKTWYNGEEWDQKLLINDVSSIIFGYATVKQKRIKAGE